jgi:pyruvate formate lyase activating enzyme
MDKGREMTHLNSPEDDHGDAAEGMIFSIQRYSIQDGPGIRTTVFLKGCPLQCKWCSNPESQNPYPEIMVRRQKCQACERCMESCESGAITMVDGAVHIDRSVCVLCMRCVDACPTGTLEVAGKLMTLEEVVEESSRDELFYQNSGGGVTLSGGEPLYQPEFTYHFLRRCKERALSTALDTCGYAQWEILERVLPFTDVVLFDLKHLDTAMHLEGTGVGNELIRDNLKRILLEGKTRVWIRIPVITGYNDSEQYIMDLAVAIRDMPVEKISLLGYHEWGRSKYASLGREYPLDGTVALDKDRLERLKEIMESEGLSVTIDY